MDKSRTGVTRRCGWVRVRALGALALVAALGLHGAASATHVGEDVDSDTALASASDQLLASLAAWERSAPAARAAREAALARLAEHRQQHLLRLLQQRPQALASRLLPKALRARLPATAAAWLERDVALVGTVRARVEDDFDRGRSVTAYTLATAGAPLGLVLADAAATDSGGRALLPWLNRRVQLDAVRIGNQLAVLDRRTLRLEAGGDGSADTASTPSTAAAPVEGNQDTLVVLGSFSDVAVECGASELQGRLFGTGGVTMNQGYLESSAGRVSFSGRVIGPFPLNQASTAACSPDSWSTTLDAAARAAGVEPDSYARVSYVTPRNANCGWSGLATLGGSLPTPSWIQSCTKTGLFSHELGHNLGFNHASTPTAEYGDYSDPMGASRLVQSNAANRVMAGWLAGTAQIQDVAAGGSYAVGALGNTASTSPRVLRLPKADTAESYYVSMRQPFGLDTALLSAYQNALSIHRASGSLPGKTVIVAILAPGQTWSDAANGLQVMHQGVAGSVATAAVSFGASSCVRAAPLVSVAPASQSGAPGVSLAYTMTVSNRSSTACPASTFALQQTLPAGFSGGLTPSSLTLAPGASASTSWTVTAPATAADGTYTLRASATDGASALAGSVQAGHVVYAGSSCTRGTPLVAVNPGSLSGNAGSLLAYSVAVTNTDSSACTAATINLGQLLPSGFSASFGSGSLTLAPGASASTGWSVGSVAGQTSGTYALSVKATHASSGASASGPASALITSVDTTPPAVDFTSPVAGALLSGRSASLAVNASDASGVASVSFWVDGALLATDTTAPWATNWNLRKRSGSHVLKARATDRAGNVAETSITVTVK